MEREKKIIIIMIFVLSGITTMHKSGKKNIDKKSGTYIGNRCVLRILIHTIKYSKLIEYHK